MLSNSMGMNMGIGMNNIREMNKIEMKNLEKVHTVEMNTNQFSLRFDDQEKCEKEATDHEMHRCENCESFLTSQSQITKKAEYSEMKKSPDLPAEKKKEFLRRFDNVWICEFCLHHNNIPTEYSPPPQENPCLILKGGKNMEKMEE